MNSTRSLAITAVLVALMANAVWAATLSDAAFRVRVTEEDGAPITNAEVHASFPQNKPYPLRCKIQEYTAWTDTNGNCAITGKCNQQVFWRVAKSGYYDCTNMRLEGTNTVYNRVEPWDQLYIVQLRRIQNPVPFVGRNIGSGVLHSRDVCIPEFNKSFGFDLVESDWVVPFGKGKVADFVIWVSCEPAKMPPDYYQQHPRAIRAMDGKLTLNFGKQKDGIQEFISAPNVGSTFRSPRFAFETGYATNYVKITNGSVYAPPKLDQNFMFRVRSQVDDNGNVTNALYGKIYGVISCDANKKLKFNYLLNPKPNDRNLEFDPRKNLMPNLQEGEEPRDF